jgi:hypothetical protein
LTLIPVLGDADAVAQFSVNIATTGRRDGTDRMVELVRGTGQ